MSSIHKVCSAAVTAAMVIGLGGCVYVTSDKPDAVSREPLLVDEAMQQREWEQVTVEYPSGAVVAGSVPIPFRGTRVYRGSHFPPSHTVQPPLPEEPEPVEPGLLERVLYKDEVVIPGAPAEDPGPPPAPGEAPATQPLVPSAPVEERGPATRPAAPGEAPATQPATRPVR